MLVKAYLICSLTSGQRLYCFMNSLLLRAILKNFISGLICPNAGLAFVSYAVFQKRKCIIKFCTNQSRKREKVSLVDCFAYLLAENINAQY